MKKPKDKIKSAQIALITNVEFADVAPGIRCAAHAIIIEPPFDDGLSHAARVRGFGVDGAEPIFTIWLDSAETKFELVDINDPTKVFLGQDDTLKPLFSGALLKIGNRQIFLQCANGDHAFAVDYFARDEFEALWDQLGRRVSSFWIGPNMPTLRWLPVALVRSMKGGAE